VRAEYVKNLCQVLVCIRPKPTFGSPTKLPNFVARHQIHDEVSCVWNYEYYNRYLISGEFRVGLSYSEVICVIEVDRCILRREVFIYEHE